MRPHVAVRIAGVCGFFGVALGAFGAHLLKDKLAIAGTAAIWQTAVLYHLVHTVVLLAMAFRTEVNRWIFGLFFAGIVLFSGSLYVLALTDFTKLGAITPIGGACFLAGWAGLAS